jgi:hypothetical protein
MRQFLYCLAAIFVPACSTLAAADFEIKYLSAENVYLKGGEKEGLTVGARLSVIGPKGVKAELEVVYVSEHSASCVFVGESRDVRVGDRARLSSVPQIDTTNTVDTVTPPPTVQTPVVEIAKPKPIRRSVPLTGSISLLLYRWNDNASSNLDFTQTTTRVSLKARRLWGKEITFSMRGRGRFDKRQRNLTSDITRNDWQNSLWELSLSYQEPTSRIHASAGRILLSQASSVGYLDGLLLEGLMAEHLRVGLLGGTSPDWLYQDNRMPLMKAGGYVAFVDGEPTAFRVEQTFGALGEWHAGEINREYLILQGRFGRGAVWSIGHTAEIDVNRGWRRDRAGSALQLSNLYLNGWIRPTARARFGLSYDNRKNYWTFESRSVADSLFDDQLRQGVRLQSDLSLPAQLFVSASGGYRKRSGEADPTLSWSAMVRKANAGWKGLSLSAQYAGFDGPANRGYNYALRGTRLFAARYTLGLGYGSYRYRTDALSSYRHNNWVELMMQTDISRHYWLSALFESDSGDDIKGSRIQTEIGYRF